MKSLLSTFVLAAAVLFGAVPSAVSAGENAARGQAQPRWHQQLPEPPAKLPRPNIQEHRQAVQLPAPPRANRQTRVVPGVNRGNWAPPNNGAYYRGFYARGIWYNNAFFAYRTYAPTQYFYFAAGRYWWNPGVGYSWVAPQAQGVITIAVVETVVVPVWNPWTRTWVLQQQQVLWYYNAYWVQNLGCWVYQDFRGVYRTVRF